MIGFGSFVIKVILKILYNLIRVKYLKKYVYNGFSKVYNFKVELDMLLFVSIFLIEIKVGIVIIFF